MPADSAIWRYRIYDMELVTEVFDNILFINGKDTNANGQTYHKIFSRSYMQIVSSGTHPPILTVDASSPDIYYGAYREAGKQVFLLAGTGEQLLFDYNAGVGSMIPSYGGTIKVTAIDSILLSGVYHKRYLTTDPGYYVIEGVGSSRGLIPGLNDGGSDMQFICFIHDPVTFSPDPTVPCTYVYPYGYKTAIPNVNDPLPEISVYPVPANDILHINTNSCIGLLNAVIVNYLGQVMWQGDFNGQSDISIANWPKGVYFIRFNSGKYPVPLLKKIILN